MHSFLTLTLDICVRFRLLCSRWYRFNPINWKSGINHYIVKIQLCQRLILLNSSMTLLIQIQCGRYKHFIRNLITEFIQQYPIPNHKHQKWKVRATLAASSFFSDVVYATVHLNFAAASKKYKKKHTRNPFDTQECPRVLS